MQVQSIQHANINNQQNFGARFLVNDNFIRLWTISPKTKSFTRNVEKFTAQHKSDIIEITDIKPKTIDGIYGTEYSVVNRYNGKFATYFKTMQIDYSKSLSFLIDSIRSDKNFLQQDGLEVELYKKLTIV